MCSYFCFETNYTFFQKIDTSNRCSCFQEHGTGNSSFAALICDPCSSDGSEVCGCYHQGHETKTTIFATRFQYDFQRGVSTYSHCRNRNKESYKITANCPDGCDPGWRGDSCRERDCSSETNGTNVRFSGRIWPCINHLITVHTLLNTTTMRSNETFDVSNREDIRDKVNLCRFGPEKAIQETP
ncbi:hypothetical protein HELRODRAFT_165288 [Helobdella robusta]|uniref:Uncharacterized protein n=1 Tax=Helobdella robusta TaxID=6412 RepID=T1EWJ6_HELRO|nr:hypothetical protein HELRODRAFT_165288 [Helobdella robusta]ESN91286.1 hypothetical protein HELRODRAFT_165288 [Helobdella robusta]